MLALLAVRSVVPGAVLRAVMHAVHGTPARAFSVDELNLLQQQSFREVPLLGAAKDDDAETIYRLLRDPSCDSGVLGALGETALHVACLYDNIEAATALLQGASHLINEPMRAELYEGQTALHIAIANQNLNLVRELVIHGADVVRPRATGTFFQRDPHRPTCYYGEYVLSFAACMGNEDIVRFLLENGTPIHAQDSLGNTVLHVLVLQPNKTTACQMHDLLLSADRSGVAASLVDIANRAGLTPLKLAATEGNAVMFQHLVSKRRQVQWSYGTVTSAIYDLMGIDSWDEELSAIELITSSRKREARRLLEITPVKELVHLKWSHYGRFYFRLWFMAYMAYIITFTLCCIHRPLAPRVLYNDTDPQDNMVFVQRPLKVPDMVHMGVKHYFGNTVTGGPFHIIMTCYAWLVLVLMVMRLTSTSGEYIPMSVALILGWCNTMFFARGSQMLGPFTIMIQKMIFGDLLRFCWLMLMVLMGFSSAFHMSFQMLRAEDFPQFDGLAMVIFTMFQLFLGLLDIPIPYNKSNPSIIKVFYLAYMVFGFLLMVNLLIAMMGDTHWRVAHERDELWRAQVAATTILLERRLPRCLWPRLGIYGKDFGLDHKWYIRVEDRNDNMAQKIKRYARAFHDSVKKAEAEEGTSGALSLEAPSPSAIRTSARGWKILRKTTMAACSSESATSDPAEIVYHV
uniref:Transient receptor potential cation channel subfamily V member 6 n=1 Tax=Eptatretus burgeri TaxID=7764 RepID=A0A8C4PXG5_EPTBU